MTDPAKRSSGFTWFLAVAAAILAVLVVLLARKTARLEGDVDRLQDELRRVVIASARSKDTLAEGDALAALDVTNAAGSPETIDLRGGGPTLLLVTSVGCEACDLTLPMWARLLDSGEIPAELGPILALIDPADAGAPLPAMPQARAVYRVRNTPDTPMRRIAMTPAAFLIDGEGAIAHVWYGLPGDADLADLAVAADHAVAE